MDKDYISELSGEFQHCFFIYIENEDGIYNIERFISLGLTKILMKKLWMKYIKS